MRKARILIVDDEKGMLEACRDSLEPLEELEVELEQDSVAALKRLREESFALLITDIRMPGIDGITLLEKTRATRPDIPALVMTAFPSVETAVASMKLGSVDYLSKPFKPAELRRVVQRMLAVHRLRNENLLLTRQVERPYRFGDIVGQCETMQTVFNAIERAASTDADVLIQGETGTGKELVARSVHQRSARAEARFVPVDCSAIPESLFESELFGHEQGTFTGADRQTIGLFEFADGGSVFLDEVGELPLLLQAKILRALQERKIRRVGGREEIPVDLRIVAATNRDLATEVSARRFREDLLYRLDVVQIKLPPLRERKDDIPLLVNHFVDIYAREYGRDIRGIAPEVVEVMTQQSWPGNVRQLQNVIRRAIVFSQDDQLTIGSLPDDAVLPAGESGSDKDSYAQQRKKHLQEFEKRYFLSLLQAHQGNVEAAAKDAGMPRATFYRHLKKHDIKAETFRQTGNP